MSVSDAKQNTLSGTGLQFDADWWRGAVIYQIYPRSFQDSNNDGIGDLKGVTQRLEYIAALGVDAIWLSPFFTSPMDDFGYDVSDYKDVDPMFGTLADFDEMTAEAHAHGIKVMIDLVISHTSDQHAWFKESRSSRENAKADWYVWSEAKPDGNPPNNWLSIFGGPAWEWDSVRCQYYLHNFLASQPDLNFHHPDVQDAVLDAAKFWLDRGVDGFRLDTVNFYFHDKELRNNPPLPEGAQLTGVETTNPYAFQHHIYDKTQPENLQFLERLRALLDQYPGATSVGEIGADRDVIETTAAYTEAGKRIHMAYSFDLLSTSRSAAYIQNTIEGMENGIGSGWPSWALSNHDVVRVATRWGEGKQQDRFSPLAIALVTSLRGTPCLYQGEELGLTEADVLFEHLQDPYGIRFWPRFKGRDGCRTPMPWTADNLNASFTDGAPWLPVAPEHRSRAVGTQLDVFDSVLEKTRAFLHWRKRQTALLKGSIAFLDQKDESLVFLREHGDECILCAFNLSSAPVSIALEALDLMPANCPVFSGRLEGKTVNLEGLDAFFGRVA
ncbi:alpha-glucosidase [Roseibium hamelinense]|uniref:Alpha-glucosidase n=1 Tax=Roseibium hamelinense TaxID=150831 RepID=A0A562T1F4_9HYPH|nr:alpha-glucosidase family protein [Roseibium hamelinense]MTI44528.1 alpha-glucosidase [Roseibium hamelinense]TWI87497.1 alpha-glucosidase [Roseibium hamelinense]